MMTDEDRLVSATAALLRVVPLGQREAMLAYAAENVRSTLTRVRTDLGGREIEARVRAHVEAVRAHLGEAPRR